MQYPRPARIAWCLVLAVGCGRAAQPLSTDSPDAAPTQSADAGPGLTTDAATAPPDAQPTSAPDAQPDPDLAVARPPDALPPGSCTAPETAPLRRLTTTHYQRTVRELTGVTVTTMLPPGETRDGFDDRVEVQNNSSLQVAAWNEAAEEIVTALSARLPALTGCATIDDACARSFIINFGLRAYRRPLSTVEVDAHLALYNQVKVLGDASDGILALLRVMLQSPHFLYRPEISGAVAADRMTPSPYETATRLSYFLWGNMPDQVLFDAAARAQLSTADQLGAQVRRMLLDPRARQGTNDFVRQWLGLDRVLDVQKDAMAYPSWNAGLAAAMREEGYRFVQRVIFDGDGRLNTLLTSTDGIVNGPLAQLYGVTIPSPDWQSTSLSKVNRMGLLTQGWFLAGRARPGESSPAARGVFVRERFLCQPIPPPPPSVEPQPPSMPGGTTRERYQSQLNNPACAACHALFDGIGFTFESYDGIGAFRTTDAGKPVDTSGQITGSQDADGTVADAFGLIRRLAASAQVRDCVATRWYELAIGRPVDAASDCRAGELKRYFRGGTGDLRDLMTTIAVDASRRARPASEISPASSSPLIVQPGDQRKVQKIVLDLLGSQLAQLRLRLVLPIDRMHLDQHLTGLRELEQRLSGLP